MTQYMTQDKAMNNINVYIHLWEATFEYFESFIELNLTMSQTKTVNCVQNCTTIRYSLDAYCSEVLMSIKKNYLTNWLKHKTINCIMQMNNLLYPSSTFTFHSCPWYVNSNKTRSLWNRVLFYNNTLHTAKKKKKKLIKSTMQYDVIYCSEFARVGNCFQSI